MPKCFLLKLGNGVVTTEGTRKLKCSATNQNNLDIYLGARIRQERVRLGMSLDYVAERLDVTNSQIEKYESGRQHICGWDLYKLSLIFGLSIRDLFIDDLEKLQNNESAIDSFKTNVEFVFNRTNNSEAFGHVVNADESELIKSFSMIDDQNVRNCFVQLIRSFIPHQNRANCQNDDEIIIS